jgi:hypothetical protein
VGDPQLSIAELQSQSRIELIGVFSNLYDTAPPKRISHDLLIRAIAFRLQEKAYGGHSAGVRRRLRSFAEELRQTGTIEVKGATTVKAGTRLLREWKGGIHEVTVGNDGFIYRDQRYRSLSQIARTITGTQWSGPAFFGLKKERTEAGTSDGA